MSSRVGLGLAEWVWVERSGLVSSGVGLGLP